MAWNLFRKVRKKYKFNTQLQGYLEYPIPHSFVLSLTSDCNLTCDHCYARVYNEIEVLPRKVLEVILKQASSLGCFFFVLTGGEPMLYPDLLDILSHHSDSLFILITNGTMVTDDIAKKLSRLPHIIPVVSLEGGLEDTDKKTWCGYIQSCYECLRKSSKKQNTLRFFYYGYIRQRRATSKRRCILGKVSLRCPARMFYRIHTNRKNTECKVMFISGTKTFI